MARNRRKVKKDPRVLLPVKGLVVVIFILFVLFFVSRQTVSFLRHAGMFEISEISFPPTLSFVDPAILENVKGRNIFSVDLAGLQAGLQSRYPQLEGVRVWRQFPDRLVVYARVRVAYAVLEVGERSFVIDPEGVVLAMKQEGAEPLPRIRGVGLWENPVLGKPVRNKNLQAALDILDAVQDNVKSMFGRIAAIDMSNASRILLSLRDGPQVIMDLENVVGEVVKMGIVLSQKDLDLQKVEYLDLRFQEPVMGQK